MKITKQKEEIVYTPEERIKLNNIIKAHNRMKGSKYIKPTYNVFGYSYNDSRKRSIDLDMIKNISEADINDAAKQVLINNK